MEVQNVPKAWESVSPTRGAAPKRGSPYPQLKGPCQSAGVRIPNSRGHAKVWESVSPTRGATQKRGSPYPQLEGPRQSVGNRTRKMKERTQCVHPRKNLVLHLLRMQDLHFATNDICIAPRLANLALKSTDGLMKKKHSDRARPAPPPPGVLPKSPKRTEHFEYTHIGV